MKSYCVMMSISVYVKAKNADEAYDKAVKKVEKIEDDPCVTDILEGKKGEDGIIYY